MTIESIPAHSLAELKKFKPCASRFKAVQAMKLGKGKITAREAVAAGVSFDDLMWAASSIAIKDLDVKLRLTAWMADVAAHVLHIFEKEFSNDERPRKTIEASHQFICGNITEKEWAAWAAEAAEAAWAAGAARAAERQWQFDRLVYWLSEERPKFWPLPEKQKAKEAA